MFSDEAGTKEISAPVTISATGHDWGGWTVEKEPTGTEEGIEVRTCRNDPSHTESREIPVIIQGGQRRWQRVYEGKRQQPCLRL